MKVLPEEIRIQITEEDRLNAGHYQFGQNCLLATCLKRMGYNHDTPLYVGTKEVQIGDYRYRSKDLSKESLHAIKSSVKNCLNHRPGPHYRKSVVGKEIILTKEQE